MTHNKVPSEKLFQKVFFEKKGIKFVPRPKRYHYIDILAKIFKPLVIIVFLPVHILLMLFKRRILFTSTGGLGDDLVSTSFIKEISESKSFKFIVITKYQEIFFNNPNICYILDCTKLIKGCYTFLIIIFESNIYNSMINFRIKCRGYVSNNQFMRVTQSKDHLMLSHLNSYYYNLLKPKTSFKNEIFLTDFEIKKYSEKYSYLPKSFIIVLSECLTNPIKNWGFFKMQNLINKLDHFKFVQVGTFKEKSLNNVINLKGRTSLRELFYIVSISRGVICHEGFLTHLSSCFNIPCFTIFSGYHPPSISKYNNVIPIVYNKPLGCKYCWYFECPLKDKICINGISVKYVADIIDKFYKTY